MGDNVNEFDITTNIKLIEMLKGQMLSGIADLYTNLAEPSAKQSEIGDILADMLIMTYMLSNRLGFSYSSIDIKAIKKLKLGMLEEKQVMYNDMSLLLKHLNKERQL